MKQCLCPDRVDSNKRHQLHADRSMCVLQSAAALRQTSSFKFFCFSFFVTGKLRDSSPRYLNFSRAVQTCASLSVVSRPSAGRERFYDCGIRDYWAKL